MNRRTFLTAAFSFLIILQGCMTTSRFRVSRAGAESPETIQKYVYVLPQTILQVRVNFEKETYIPGPYRVYTQKFLGLENFIEEPGFSYHIKSVDVTPATEPDGSQFYSINVLEGQPDFDGFLKLSREGLVLDPSGFYEFKSPHSLTIPQTQAPYFTDLSVESNLREITDTLYKTMITDSSYVTIPMVRKQQEAKTQEQKAEEAANFIIKIRKHRYKLLSGKHDVFPEGDALAISVEELDKLEKEYLALFLGKTIRNEFTRSFIIVPKATQQTHTISFARFSQQLGLTGLDTNTGNELVAEIQPLDQVKTLRAQGAAYPDPLMENNLFYRIPDLADVRIRIASEILYESRLSIYQAGAMVNLPLEPVSTKAHR